MRLIPSPEEHGMSYDLSFRFSLTLSSQAMRKLFSQPASEVKRILQLFLRQPSTLSSRTLRKLFSQPASEVKRILQLFLHHRHPFRGNRCASCSHNPRSKSSASCNFFFTAAFCRYRPNRSGRAPYHRKPLRQHCFPNISHSTLPLCAMECFPYDFLSPCIPVVCIHQLSTFLGFSFVFDGVAHRIPLFRGLASEATFCSLGGAFSPVLGTDCT